MPRIEQGTVPGCGSLFVANRPNLPLLPPHPNPFGGREARLFTADRVQYILMTDSVSVYSVVTRVGEGVTNDNDLIHKTRRSFLRDQCLRDVFQSMGQADSVPMTATPGV
jgi:hypothetical protein